MTTCIQTYRSQLNNSKFKQLYSFPKAQRFTDQNVLQVPYYDNKVTALSKRGTSLGYGNKISLQKKQQVPSPNQYPKNGYFQQNLKIRKGYSFTHQPKKGIVDTNDVQFLPAPNKYSIASDKPNFKKVSYSFRGKFQNPLEKNKNQLGPGQYRTVESLNKEGKYYFSKYQSSGCSKIGNQKRFQQYSTISPGPGKYQDVKVTGINKSGTYYCSTFRTTKANSFSKSPRKDIAESKIAPGPGHYQRFSQFPLRSK